MKQSKNKPYPGVTSFRDRHGKIRWRYRAKGRTFSLPGPFASADFKMAYEAALEGQRRPQRPPVKYGTLSWLIIEYLASMRFQQLADSRRDSVRRQLDWLRNEAGDLPIAQCEPRHVEALMMRKTGPTAGNNVKKAMSFLFNFAINKLNVKNLTNPAKGAEKRRERKGGFKTWSDAEIEQYLKTHPSGSQARLALLLVLNTGASRVDLAKMGWGHVWGNRIVYARQKTGVKASLPIIAELAEELALVPQERAFFLATRKGAKRSDKALGAWFAEHTKKAGLVNCTLHGVRKAGAKRLAEAGATSDEIKSYLAHATAREGSTYTDAADRAALADRAFARLTPRVENGGKTG